MNKCIYNPLLKRQKNAIVNRCIIILFCFVICLTLFSFVIPTLFAADDSNVSDIKEAIKQASPSYDGGDTISNDVALKMYNALPAPCAAAYNWAEALYGGDAFDEVFTKYLSLRLPTASTTTDDAYKNYFMRAVNTLSPALATMTSLGVGLLCIWFFVDLIAKATADSFTVEHFVKSMMKFVAGYIVLTNLIEPDGSGGYKGLVPIIINGVADIVESLQGSTAGGGAALMIDSPLVMVWYKLYVGHWLTASLSVILDLLLPSLLTTVSRVLIRAFALGRIIELSLLVIFSPVAISNIFGDASHDQNYGIKFLKKLGAIELQGLIMNYCVLIATNIQGAMNGANVIGAVAIVCVEAALIARSRNIANEIVGVH